MDATQGEQLDDVIQSAATKIRRYRDRRIGEQNTKATLIEPLLEALGWDIRDPDEVHREFKANAKDNPVDYALKILRKPRLFLEAKGLGQNISDRKWIAQVLGYAIVAGVEWCVLSDGDQYSFYNATVAVDAEEKLFCEVKISEDNTAEVAKALALISRDNMEENLLDVCWAAHFVDRRVKVILQDMLGAPDRGLVRLIRKRLPQLKPKEISESLARLDVQIESPESFAPSPPTASKTAGKKEGTGKPKKGQTDKGTRTDFAVAMTDLIASGVLDPPVKLFKKYKGQDMEATLLFDGSVKFQGSTYSSCSAAAEAARRTVTGRKMNTNGWRFWQYRDEQGKIQFLADARQRFLDKK